TGSTLTSGGYRTQAVEPLPGDYNASVMASLPAFGADKIATGWQLKAAQPFNQQTPVTTVFARCAKKNLSPSTVTNQTVDLTKTLAAWGHRDVSVKCPVNTFTAGGGYELVGNPTIPRNV